MGYKAYTISTVYLNNDLLFDAISAIDPFYHVIRAAVLYDSVAHFDFPFEHADHKFSIQQEFSAAV